MNKVNAIYVSVLALIVAVAALVMCILCCHNKSAEPAMVSEEGVMAVLSNNPQMIIDTLQLPELVFPLTTITVGYPDSIPAQVDRLPLEAAVHQETYHDYTSEDIDKLYAYKESLPENKQFIEENQKETLAQVFTDIRYTKKDNEFMSDNLLKVLRQQGFLK